jgi:predicted transcriptional regulator
MANRDTRNMSLRLDPALAEELEVVAVLEERTVSDVIRDAIRAHVRRRMKDPAFQRLLEESIRRDERILAEWRQAGR